MLSGVIIARVCYHARIIQAVWIAINFILYFRALIPEGWNNGLYNFNHKNRLNVDRSCSMGADTGRCGRCHRQPSKVMGWMAED